MPGSSQSIAGPNTILNTIMAEELGRFADRLTGAADFQQALNILLREVFQRHRRIIFGGNGYDSAWMAEAERRGLVNLPNTAAALPAYILPKNVALMTKHGVYTTSEMLARHEIHMEKILQADLHRGGDARRHGPAQHPARGVALRGRSVPDDPAEKSRRCRTRTAAWRPRWPRAS